MKQLLIRADDIGYSYAVNLGIARSVNEGLVRSVGVMPNMPETARGWSWVADSDIAVGQHTNVCLGRPCADPARVSSLHGPDGRFRSSREYRASWKEGVDFVDYDEAVIEIEAQLARFLEVVGREPDYFEAHAVLSDNLNRAIADVATAHGFRHQIASFDPTATVTCGNTPVRMVMRSMEPGYEPAESIKQTVREMGADETVVFVAPPGISTALFLRLRRSPPTAPRRSTRLSTPSCAPGLRNRTTCASSIIATCSELGPHVVRFRPQPSIKKVAVK